MIDDLLTGIGLSEKEARMYVTLLRHGTQPTSVLAKKAGLNRGTGYVILHELLEKGLAIKTTRKKIQYFAPLDPDQLIKFVDHQRQELKGQKEQIQAMMGQLVAISNPLTSKPKIQFFEGQEGARNVLDSTLKSKEKLLRAFLSIADVSDFAGAEYFNDYTSRRVKNGYILHAIRTLEKDRIALERDIYARRYQTSRKEHRDIRYVSDDLAFPVSIYMFDDKLAVLSSKEENFALLIESRELAQMQKKLFELIWPTLRKMRGWR